MSMAWKSPAGAFCVTCLLGPFGALYLDWKSALRVAFLQALLVLAVVLGTPLVELRPGQVMTVTELPLRTAVAWCAYLVLFHLAVPTYALRLTRRRNRALGLGPPPSSLMPTGDSDAS